MNTYQILLTDSIGTKLVANEEGEVIHFTNRNIAEREACKLISQYYLVQVSPYELTFLDTNYVLVNDAVLEESE